MVTEKLRIDKSSHTRGPDYMLLYRLRQQLGQRVVDRALAGDRRALDTIERFAWEPRKRPGLVAWVSKMRRQAAIREAAARAANGNGH